MKTIPVLCVALAAVSMAPAASADNPVAQTIQKLHLSAQQLLSVRDFLGPFNRGTEVDASGGGVFILRDTATMAYAGAFSLRTAADGSVAIDRIGGPATLDGERTVTLPLGLDRKSRAQVSAVLDRSQALPTPLQGPPTDSGAPAAAIPVLSLPREDLAGLRLTGTVTGVIAQSRAVFFRDGSGYVRSFRAQLPATGAAPQPLKIVDRYFSPIQSDGTKVWRPAIVETDADLPVSFVDLQTKYACDASAPCKPQRAVQAQSGIHLIKWTHQLVASVPQTLLAQIAPPPAAPVESAPDAASPPSLDAPQQPQQPQMPEQAPPPGEPSPGNN